MGTVAARGVNTTFLTRTECQAGRPLPGEMCRPERAALWALSLGRPDRRRLTHPPAPSASRLPLCPQGPPGLCLSLARGRRWGWPLPAALAGMTGNRPQRQGILPVLRAQRGRFIREIRTGGLRAVGAVL